MVGSVALFYESLCHINPTQPPGGDDHRIRLPRGRHNPVSNFN